MDEIERDVPGAGCARLLLPYMRAELVVTCLMEEIGLSEDEAVVACKAAASGCHRCAVVALPN